MDEKSLSHTRWVCQYHVVLVPKLIYGKLRKDIGRILRQLCEYKHVEIIEAEAMPDHIHMLISIPPKLAVSDFIGYLKGKSTLMIFEKHANLKYKYGRRVLVLHKHGRSKQKGSAGIHQKPAERRYNDGSAKLSGV